MTMSGILTIAQIRNWVAFIGPVHWLNATHVRASLEYLRPTLCQGRCNILLDLTKPLSFPALPRFERG